MSTIVLSIIKFLKKQAESSDQLKSTYIQEAIDKFELAFDLKDKEVKQDEVPDLVELFKHMGFDESLCDPESAEKEKVKGNDFMAKKMYKEAIECYSKAIDFDPRNPAYFGNRAAGYIELRMLDEAMNDCFGALSLNKNYSKAYSRLGDYCPLTCCEMLKRFGMSRKFGESDVFDPHIIKFHGMALELDPGNKSYTENIDICKQKLNEADDNSSSFFPNMLNTPAMQNMMESILANPEMMNQVKGVMSQMYDSFSQGKVNVMEEVMKLLFLYNFLKATRARNMFEQITESNPKMQEQLEKLKQSMAPKGDDKK